MKVLHLINTLSAGGAELHLLTLCRHLKRQGVEVVVACLREYVKDSRLLRPDFEQEGIQVINLRADNSYNGLFLYRLARLLKEEQPHILHTHLPRADIAAALVHQFIRSPALLCSVHGIYQHLWFGRWAAPLMRWAYREADGIIAISYAVKNWLGQNLGVPPEKVAVVHYGIEMEQFAHPQIDFRKAWGLKEQVLIGSVGRMEARKGFDCLIQAMGMVQKYLPNACLLIAGHNPLGYGETLQALIDHLQLSKQARLVGFQSDVPSFLHALDVFAFASRTEGFGQVVIEAMATGKPVVASKIPPLTEIVVDGETGLLVELDNPQAFAHAILWLLAHPEKAVQMGRQGQERVYSNFFVEGMLAKTLSLYQRLIKASQ